MLSYNELLEKYNDLISENEQLRRELKELRSRFGVAEKKEVYGNDGSADTAAAVNQFSTPEEKIALFRSLFIGREDVFAKRWYSKTSGKCGYQPVCGNEWVEGLCDKRKYKCSSCPNRKLLPITDKDIYAHLAGKDEYGRDVVGTYPMLLDETCRFLCVDFDEDQFLQDAAAFREVCVQHDIPVHIERSRSGCGAHAWVLFDAPVPAKLARKLGSGILTKAMESYSDLSFKSYDRLFPNQDTMPEGGFGNLVALPLQGQARKSGNSVFVDESFTPYPDQWIYLSTAERLSAERIDDLITVLCKHDELGVLVTDSDEKPWEPRKVHALAPLDFSESLKIVRANMLYVPVRGLSSAARNAIKRLAAFRNPDFYRTQAMRLPIYDKPRVICTADITEKYIALPRGCENALVEMLNDARAHYEIENKTNSGAVIPVEFSGTLRDEQQLAAEALLKHDIGVLSATTAFGKTIVASYLIGSRKVNTLVLVHTQALMLQWKDSLERFLRFDIEPPEQSVGRGRRKAWSPVGLLGAGKNTLHGNADVAVMQSLVSGDEVKDLVRDYGMIIVDECHHVSAVNFESILKYTNARYIYGLTATPTRQDGHHPIIFMQCGPIRYRVDAKEQAEKRSFEHYVIPRFTAYRNVSPPKDITSIYRSLAENDARNEYIIKDVIDALEQKRSPIILTERREHVEYLAERLKTCCSNIIALHGAASQQEKRKAMERLVQIMPDEPMLIIATGKYVGEGFDYPRLDTLFLALPISWKGKVAQYAGRLHRDYAGKTEVRIFDYVDVHIPMLEKMYQKRLKGYASIGYRTKSHITPNISPDLIYDGKSFYPVLSADLQAAERDILIVSPFMRKSRLTHVVKLLSSVMLKEVSITVVTRPPENFRTEKEQETVMANTEYLREYGISVVWRSNFHQKFVVIDQRIVWYGSVNFLSFGTADESVMRLESEDVAGQLMDTVE